MRIEKRSIDGTEECELQDYISRELDGADGERGALEEAAATAENVKEALARLLDLLADYDKISLDDVSRIVNGFAYNEIKEIKYYE